MLQIGLPMFYQAQIQNADEVKRLLVAHQAEQKRDAEARRKNIAALDEVRAVAAL